MAGKTHTGVLKFASADDCPDKAELHTPCPVGYLAWHSWAKDMAKTHKQERCSTCGFYSVWVVKESKAKLDRLNTECGNGLREQLEARGLM